MDTVESPSLLKSFCAPIKRKGLPQYKEQANVITCLHLKTPGDYALSQNIWWTGL